MNIPVVYEDNWLLVLNKPSGLLTIPAPGKPKRTLIKILNDYAKDRGQSWRLHPCHRLDRETSGLIIFAKGKSIQKMMMQEFKQKSVAKTYIALVSGRVSKNQALIRNPINSKPAVTRYQVIQRHKHFSVVKVQTLTGRKNQIRIHFKQIGHPIIGEDRFAFRRDFQVKAKRLCLHAQGLDFAHPVTKQRIKLKTELPEYFRELTRAHF